MKTIIITSIVAKSILLLSFTGISYGTETVCANATTGLLCTPLTLKHNYLNPDATNLEHCNALNGGLLPPTPPTPHCCRQFCAPAAGGTCEQSTGVCRCNGVGKPTFCNAYFSADNPNTNLQVLSQCTTECNAGDGSTVPGSCKTPAYVTDGFNYICVCYCP